MSRTLPLKKRKILENIPAAPPYIFIFIQKMQYNGTTMNIQEYQLTSFGEKKYGRLIYQ